jgi:uncharacterized repeat protein (TIGR03843 family)
MVTDVNTSPQELVLREGELVVTGRLVDASNATLLATASLDDVAITCIYKPIAGERPLWDFPEGKLAHREYAAYLLSRESGLNVVPLTVLRDGPFGEGMVQEWIFIDESIDFMEFFQSDNVQLRKMALFDAVINNTDRKIGHLLPTQTGSVFGCDHGVTFHREDKLRTVLWQWAGRRFTEEERQSLKALNLICATSLGEKLLSHITSQEIDALKMRIQRLIDTGVFPNPSTEWPAVPWPPF